MCEYVGNTATMWGVCVHDSLCDLVHHVVDVGAALAGADGVHKADLQQQQPQQPQQQQQLQQHQHHHHSAAARQAIAAHKQLQ